MLALIAVLADPAGCATTKAYEEGLNSWIGKDVSDLIVALGPPADTYTVPDGRKLLVWVFNGGAVAMPVGNAVVAIPRGCKTTFVVSPSGIVQSWRWQGNACTARSHAKVDVDDEPPAIP